MRRSPRYQAQKTVAEEEKPTHRVTGVGVHGKRILPQVLDQEGLEAQHLTTRGSLVPQHKMMSKYTHGPSKIDENEGQ
ncbi:hypothetical protein ANCDUO_14813 [Ancylostoma duodenale]|uniref:Uncharacterized protein n=1 Tax=Ancylostoma duodenale TaxID=51022 RepID=A0A0C2CFC7_9BILA|nr:hypothetical protein ANCDUO_14813 [Ancylostoma duodenale]